jgi:hypothetical protein
MPTRIDTAVPIPSFRLWLEEHHLQQVPDAGMLALLIARSGAAGVSRDDLRRLAGIPPDTLDDLLRAMVASGQVAMVKVGGKIGYRAAG